MIFRQAARFMAGGLLLTVALAWQPASGHGSDGAGERLPVMGEAPAFTLTDQGGMPFSSASLRGKVAAVSFIFTECADTCPLLTDKLARIADELGPALGPEIAFVSITVDPAHDDPATLRDYAHAMGADHEGWEFLTGTDEQIRAVAASFGVYIGTAGGEPSHNLLTSIIDRSGMMRVQYMGERFDPAEFVHDLLDLAREDR